MTSLLDWFLNIGHKFAGLVIFATQLLVHWEDILDRFSSLLGLKKILERRNKHMGNILADLQLAMAAAAELKTALPVLGQAAADLKQAFADKADPTKATADLAAALDVVLPLIEQIVPLLPSPNVPKAAA
jgi:hypothetical protein